MSRFFTYSEDYTPYIPGEQPKNQTFIKLNTNESPFPPSPKAIAYAKEATGNLHLYSDPTCEALTNRACEVFGVKPEEIMFSNGSDEMLHFLFLAFCDENTPAVFPTVTYGFYKILAGLHRVPCREVKMLPDLSVDLAGLSREKGTVFLANPNAPTGLVLSPEVLEGFVADNPDRLIVVDEAYVDFGAQTAVPLTKKYDNILVIGTFSKSRSLAGGRLGYAIGCPALMDDLRAMRFSVNPFDVNAMTMAAGLGALEDTEYFANNCRAIMDNRAWTTQQLREIGFAVVESATNFVLMGHPRIGGADLNRMLRERGILARHFNQPEVVNYVRVTIGTREQMECFISAIKDILEVTHAND